MIGAFSVAAVDHFDFWTPRFRLTDVISFPNDSAHEQQTIWPEIAEQPSSVKMKEGKEVSM